MSNLANMFAVLNLDAEDDREEVKQPTSSKKEGSAAAATGKLDRGRQNHTMIVNYDGENLASSSSDYKLPFVWIDLEMTGLDITKDRILEIACIITDGKLTKRIEGPDLVIRQSKECLDGMNEWCKIHHGASGLTEQVLQSDISEHDAEKQVLDFIRRYIGSATPLIAGNSVYMDLLFLKKYMPQLAGILSHVIVDVSSISALCSRWFPKGLLISQSIRGHPLSLIATNSSFIIIFVIHGRLKSPPRHEFAQLLLDCSQKGRKLQERRKTIGRWMILEKASWSYNTTRRTFSKRGNLSSIISYWSICGHPQFSYCTLLMGRRRSCIHSRAPLIAPYNCQL